MRNLNFIFQFVGREFHVRKEVMETKLLFQREAPPFGRYTRDKAGGTKPKDRLMKGHFSNQDVIHRELELTVGMRRGRLK